MKHAVQQREDEGGMLGRRVHHADGVVGLGQDVAGSIAGDRVDGSQCPSHARQVCARTIVQPPNHLRTNDGVSHLPY